MNTPNISLIANRAAKRRGSNRATEIVKMDGERVQELAVRGTEQTRSGEHDTCMIRAQAIYYDPYHAESRTGIRASMAALKRFWSTYHYVASVCVVEAPDIDAIYSCDSH